METAADSNLLLLITEEEEEKQRVKRRTTSTTRSSDGNKNNISSSMEMAISCEDIAAKIFGDLPLETLINCKFVSTLWKQMVCFLFSSSPSYGFITPYYPSSCFNESGNGSNMLPVKSGFAYTNALIELEKNLLSYSGKQKNWTLLDSCNGLLLFYDLSDRLYYVCNPITNEYTVLPRPQWALCMLTYVGLAFHGHHYKVVNMGSLDSMDEIKQIMNGQPPAATFRYEVFSSETWSWVQLRKTFFDVSLLRSCGHHRFPGLKHVNATQGVYFNGSLCWSIKGTIYMLMYHVEKDLFRFVELPKYDFGEGIVECVGGFLSESSGRMYYSYPSSWRKFYVWEYNKGERDGDGGYNIIKDSWLLKYVSDDVLSGCWQNLATLDRIRHCRFYDDFKLVYFQ